LLSGLRIVVQETGLQLAFGAAVLLVISFGACLDEPKREPGQWPIEKAELQALAAKAAAAPSDPGEAAYRRICVACHGIDGTGSEGKIAANFGDPAGVLTKQDDLLRASILNGVTSKVGVMPPHRTLLTDDEVTAVLAYVRNTFGKGIVPSAVATAPDAGSATP
jgi:mono/diheme cytochrome c family protein